MITKEERADVWDRLYRERLHILCAYAQVIEDFEMPTLDFVVPKGTIVQVEFRRSAFDVVYVGGRTCKLRDVSPFLQLL